MVQISIHPLRNLNHGGRWYPHSGYLGLTKVLVEGIVRTRKEEDRKNMAASSVTISVKCYEARTKLTCSKINTLVDATVVLWSSPVHTESTDIGDMDLPFRVALPPTVTGHSSLSFPDYKIFWRLEAVINHPPHFGLGVRQIRFYDLNITRYDVQDPPISPFLLQPSPIPGYRLYSSSPRIPPFYYRIDDPDHAVGPGDELPAVVNFIFDSNTSVVQLQSISVVLERKLDLFEASGSPTQSEILSVNGISPYSNSSEASSVVSLSSLMTNRSSVSAYSQRPLSRKRSASPPSNHTLPSKSISSTIASAQTSLFSCHAPDHFSSVANLSLPAKPPPSQWPVGESLKTDLAQIRFELRVKVTLVSASGPVEVALDSMEIRLAPLSQEQRSIARDKVKKRQASRSKSAPSSRRASRSPSSSSSSKGGPDTPPIPTAGTSSSILDIAAFNQVPQSPQEFSPEHVTAGRKSRTTSKRRSQTPIALSTPPTRQRSASNVHPSVLKSRASANSSGGSKSADTSTTTITPLTGPLGVTVPTTDLKHMPSNAVRAWEEELEKITTRSKRRSDDMVRGSASDVEKSSRSIRGTRTRRGTANALCSSLAPSAYALTDKYSRSRPATGQSSDSTW